MAISPHRIQHPHCHQQSKSMKPTKAHSKHTQMTTIKQKHIRKQHHGYKHRRQLPLMLSRKSSNNVNYSVFPSSFSKPETSPTSPSERSCSGLLQRMGKVYARRMFRMSPATSNAMIFKPPTSVDTEGLPEMEFVPSDDSSNSSCCPTEDEDSQIMDIDEAVSERRRVQFVPSELNVTIEIQHHSEFSVEEKSQIWTNRKTLRNNARLNMIEHRYESNCHRKKATSGGGAAIKEDSVVEETDFILVQGGVYVHPAHVAAQPGFASKAAILRERRQL